MLLSKIFDEAPKIEVNALTMDSREVSKGCMYFCLEGMTTDGHNYIDQAIEKGAICIVHSKDIEHMVDDVVYIKVENVNKTMNRVAALFYGEPSKKMMVFGVTGTNGKSTITNIIQDIYNKFYPCGYIGTIAIRYGDQDLQPEHTTPNAIFIHKTLKDMVDAGMKAVSLEVSSHGLEQGRVTSVDFDIVVFTNLTYEHLDYHGTIENYFKAKCKLFELVKKEGVAILNMDDDYYQRLKDSTKARVVTYGINHQADYRANHIKLHTKGSTFMLYAQQKEFEIHTNLVATYNIYNLLAAIAAMCESGLDIEAILPYLDQIEQIDGRMERIDEGQPFEVIVDYAHTPDGFEKIFEYANTITSENRRIITVFGCAGKRDMKKRPVLGEIASKYCDLIVLTEEDPRDEEPADIATEIRNGIVDTNNIFIENRYDAIRQAIESANVGDTVLILGKGDEIFMDRSNRHDEWIGDHVAARHILRKYYLGMEEDEISKPK
ncbi:MAG: UDP-N-acetylmuramoyl-L-alanyl-D-glutamate--2,6-diaminopimelate ligase [Erysipelotrichaceae bacterium]